MTYSGYLGRRRVGAHRAATDGGLSDEREWPGVFILVALVWLWANLHSGVVVGLFVLALHALEPLLLPRTAPWAPRLRAATAER